MWTDELCFHVHIFCVSITIPGGFTSTFWNLLINVLTFLSKLTCVWISQLILQLAFEPNTFKHVIQWCLQCIYLTWMFQIITTTTKCCFTSRGFQELILWSFHLPWKCIFFYNLLSNFHLCLFRNIRNN